MKNMLLFFVGLIGAFSQAQTDKIIYGGTERREGQSKEELYLTAQMWLASEFKDSAIKAAEKEGRLAVAAFFEYVPSTPNGQGKGSIRYCLVLVARDGEYDYEITDFWHEPKGNARMSVGLLTNSAVFPKAKDKYKRAKDSIWKDIKEQLPRLVLPVYLSLTEAMANTNVPDRN